MAGSASKRHTTLPRDSAPHRPQVHIRKQTGSGRINVCKCRFTDITASDAPYQRHSMGATDRQHAPAGVCRHTPDEIDLTSRQSAYLPLYRDIPVGTLPIARGDRVVVSEANSPTAGSVAAAHGPRQRSNNMPPHFPGAEYRMARRHDPRLIRKSPNSSMTLFVTEISAI